ncbi:MAG: MBOAT family protein [Nitrosopumilus sp.]|nr:MAG: MBOAT family protein [Nitrosopumilus sp.]
MLFNTIEFVVFFVVVLAVISIIRYRKFQHLYLLGASYFFFYFSSNYLVTLLAVSTLLDFYIGKEIFKSQNKSRKKILLITSLTANLGLLGFFKYTDFAIAQFNILGNHINLGTEIPLLNIILPIGISFYTFQTISYTVDIYRGQLTPSKSFWEFALFVSFFPQLVAGPIIRAKDFLPQLREKIDSFSTGQKLRLIVTDNSNLKLGITIMSFGFLKKMFFADNIAPLANHVFDNPIGQESFTIIIGAIAFGIQIYGDFSGYTDIAIGAALILGFKIPINFNKPYFATSPSDFWGRWHISLSTWLRDYLYIPLGGSRKSEKRTYVNLATVMFLGGLWHGASWNFVIWGMLHGLYLAIHRIISDKIPFLKNHSFFKTKLGVVFSIFVTQYLIFLTWIAFRVHDFNDLLYSMQKYVILDFAIKNTSEIILTHKLEVVLIVAFFILNYISYRRPNMRETVAQWSIWKWSLVLLGIALLILFFYDGHPKDFIYFKF